MNHPQQPSLLSGHAQYVKGQAESVVGNITNSQEWKSSGEDDKAAGLATMQKAGEQRDTSKGYGKVEELAGKVTGCEVHIYVPQSEAAIPRSAQMPVAVYSLRTNARVLLAPSMCSTTSRRYLCLHAQSSPEAPASRKAIVNKFFMGYDMFGKRIALSGGYGHEASEERHIAGRKCCAEMDRLLSDAKIKLHPIKVLESGWQSRFDGPEVLRMGEMSGTKLVASMTYGRH
ncbi:hypothetical protein PWT90_09468 [Aphanocladium album]|nr:hypothetical protein PWT90_09468 [Aphanocladium album]